MSKLTAVELSKQGMLSMNEVKLIHDIAKLLPPSPAIINIGAGFGTSAMAFLEAREDAYILSVDKKPRRAESDNLSEAGLLKLNRVFRVLGDSSRFGKNFPRQWPVDACFVDGAHHDSAVVADIESWKKTVIPGGYMFFHDYHHPNVPGLTLIVDDMMSDWEQVGSARYLTAFKNTNG